MRSHYMLALYYANQKLFPLAIKHFDKAIENGANFPDEFMRLLEPYRTGDDL